MDERETNDSWSAEHVDRWAEEADRLQVDPNHAAEQSPVLAQVPDLDCLDSEPEEEQEGAVSDGRILSQGTSTKLLLGACVLLVSAAVIPWIFNGDDDPKPGESPAPNADVAPDFDPVNLQASQENPAAANATYQPNLEINTQVPSGPDFTQATNPTSLTPIPPGPASRPSASPWNNGTPGLPPPHAQGHAPHLGQGTLGQGTLGQGPTSPPISQSRPRANRAMSLGAVQAGGEAMRNQPPYYQADARASAVANRPVPRIGITRPAEPGVAQLKGIIEKPSVRTSHDSGRPSIY